MREKDIQDMMDALKSAEKFLGANFHHWRYVLENCASIWTRAPFKINDLVKLNKTPEITEKKSWGWLGAKHFLVEGAIAKVVEVEFYKGKFVYGLHFFNDSWINKDGKIMQRSEKGCYSFSEDWLVSANYDQLSCEAL